MHAFISKDNDRLIKQSLETGVRYLRKAKAKARAKDEADTAAGTVPSAGAGDAPGT